MWGCDAVGTVKGAIGGSDFNLKLPNKIRKAENDLKNVP